MRNELSDRQQAIRLWFGTANGAAYVDPRTINLHKVNWR